MVAWQAVVYLINVLAKKHSLDPLYHVNADILLISV